MTAPSLQEYFVDKTSGLPLSGGKVYFWQDASRTIPKTVYELQGNSANYTYSPLPNPLTLSGVGTMMDSTYNDIIPYYYPFNEDNPDQTELYYIVVYDSMGQEQFSRQAWPNPTSSGGSEGGVGDSINYIPNGQFLSHTNIPNDTLIGGSNIIAQGGFTIELDNSPAAVNTLTFQRLDVFTENPVQSPRYIAIYRTTGSTVGDTTKKIRIKWKDVNKFSTESENNYTFAFWAQSNITINADINVFKFFGTGGTPSADQNFNIGSISITPDTNFNNLQFNANFQDNQGAILGTNQDDFVAIDISLPVQTDFIIEFTDFVLQRPSGVPLTGFPIQTDADMLGRGVAGWMDTPNPDGSDLFLPLVLTREGMQFDHGSIGKIQAASGNVFATSDTSSYTNDMLCDGAAYLSSNYSALGIPYSRLGNYFLRSSSVSGYPIYGTGLNYATAWTDSGDANSFYIISNNAGTPISIANSSGGATGFTFSGSASYAGAQIGRAGLYTTTSWPGGSSVYFQALASSFVTTAVSNGTSGFGLALFSTDTGLFAEQSLTGFGGNVTSAAALAVLTGAAKSFTFTISTGPTTFTIWYRINNLGTVGTTATDFVIDLPSTATGTQVAQITTYVLKNLQISRVTAVASPPIGSFFTFQTNPGALRTVQPWYSYADGQSPTSSVGELVEVRLPGSPSAAIVAAATYATINAYQFASPDLRGMFLRGSDITGIYDLDFPFRINQGLGNGGNGSVGTYELQQFLSHLHNDNLPVFPTAVGFVPNIAGTSNTTSSGFFNNTTDLTGGSETRPVNSNVNWVIKY